VPETIQVYCVLSKLPPDIRFRLQLAQNDAFASLRTLIIQNRRLANAPPPVPSSTTSNGTADSLLQRSVFVKEDVSVRVSRT